MQKALNTTDHVLLGALTVCPMSGYDIKQFLDMSTRHFWAISYGQIYPELKELEARGLVRGESGPTGARKRTVFTITDAGRQALAGFVSDPTPNSCEIRDEMLLRLFFSDVAPPAERRRLLEAMADRHRRTAAELAAHEPLARSTGMPAKHEVLRYGVALHRFAADYFEQLAKEEH